MLKQVWMVAALLVCSRSSIERDSITPTNDPVDTVATFDESAFTTERPVKRSSFSADGLQPELGFLPIRL